MMQDTSLSILTHITRCRGATLSVTREHRIPIVHGTLSIGGKKVADLPPQVMVIERPSTIPKTLNDDG